MWTASHTESASTTPQAIWDRWIDVTHWPEQDPALISAAIAGPFVVGSVITLKPEGSPTVTVMLIEVTPNRSFSSEGSLPLAKLQFDHTVESTPTGVQFKQSVTVTGPLTWLWSRLLGPTMATNLTRRMQNLARLVELR